MLVWKLTGRIVQPCLMICDAYIRRHSLPFEQLLMSPMCPITLQHRPHQLPITEIRLFTDLLCHRSPCDWKLLCSLKDSPHMSKVGQDCGSRIHF